MLMVQPKCGLAIPLGKLVQFHERRGEAAGRWQTDRGEYSPATANPQDAHGWASTRGSPRRTTRALMAIELVLDAIVSLAWFLKGTPERAAYAAAVSAAAADGAVLHVPVQWGIEMGHVLLREHRRKVLNRGKLEQAIEDLDDHDCEYCAYGDAPEAGAGVAQK